MLAVTSLLVFKLQFADLQSIFAHRPMKTKLLFFAVVVVLASCKKELIQQQAEVPQPRYSTTLPDNDHLLLGNPTSAVSDTSSRENYLKDNKFYKLAYGAARGIPTWVSWHMQSEDWGTVSRQPSFTTDILPTGWYRVTTNSYTNSGFDRGHNCPSADRNGNVEANTSTFMMTNIIPQAPALNRGPWAGLEEFIRVYVSTSNEAYIYMGNFGAGGKGSAGAGYAIDNGRVAVPEYVWKFALIIPKGDSDLHRIDTSATLIAVQMPNDESKYSGVVNVKSVWRNYLCTLEDIEKASAGAGTAVHLLTEVKPSVATYLKKKRFQ